VIDRQVEQHDVPGGAFDQGADRGPVALPGDESGSPDALLRRGPLRTVLAAFTAHGSSKPLACAGCGPFFRSPACVAAKILCRKRRTSSVTCRQLIDSQSTSTSCGPFVMPTTPPTGCPALRVIAVITSNLPFGSEVHIAVSSPPAHPAHVSALSGSAYAVSGQLSATAAEGAAKTSRFPAAFRPPAFASLAVLSR